MKILFSFLAVLLISIPNAQAADIKINQKFSGATHPTMIDSDDDNVFASAGSYQIFGSPGRATAEGFAEFSAFEPTGGTPGCELRAEMVTDRFAETFNDGSMLFNWVTEGFNCVDLATGEIGGELIGIMTGGTGRFEQLPSSSFTATRPFHPYPEETRSSLDGFAVQCSYCGTRLVPLHFHETETLAFAGEDVMGQVDGSHGSELAEKVSDITFLGLGWQVAYENFEHGRVPWSIEVRCRTKK